MSDAESLVRRWFDAANRQAIAEMVDCLAEEAVFDPPGTPRVIGREAIETALIGAFSRSRLSVADLVVLSDGGSRAAAEYTLRRHALATGEERTEAAGAFFEIEDGRLARVTIHTRAG